MTAATSTTNTANNTMEQPTTASGNGLPKVLGNKNVFSQRGKSMEKQEKECCCGKNDNERMPNNGSQDTNCINNQHTDSNNQLAKDNNSSGRCQSTALFKDALNTQQQIRLPRLVTCEQQTGLGTLEKDVDRYDQVEPGEVDESELQPKCQIEPQSQLFPKETLYLNTEHDANQWPTPEPALASASASVFQNLDPYSSTTNSVASAPEKFPTTTGPNQATFNKRPQQVFGQPTLDKEHPSNQETTYSQEPFNERTGYNEEPFKATHTLPVYITSKRRIIILQHQIVGIGTEGGGVVWTRISSGNDGSRNMCCKRIGCCGGEMGDDQKKGHETQHWPETFDQSDALSSANRVTLPSPANSADSPGACEDLEGTRPFEGSFYDSRGGGPKPMTNGDGSGCCTSSMNQGYGLGGDQNGDSHHCCQTHFTNTCSNPLYHSYPPALFSEFDLTINRDISRHISECEMLAVKNRIILCGLTLTIPVFLYLRFAFWV